jgi:Zn-dependent M28 family amino/carboxypeptidase
VIVGAHLDSVTEGPGINDNGSDTAQNLEIAEEPAELKVKPRRQIMFAFWAAEPPTPR